MRSNKVFEIERLNNIDYITIKNNRSLKMVFSSLGASIFAIYYDDALMTLSLADKNDYANPELYHGKTIGPVCGRIPNGQIGEYHYELNEENVARHGGKNGLSTRVFDYEIVEKIDTVSLIFKRDGFVVEYCIEKESDCFVVGYHYQGKAQPISLTNHTFFHLGDAFEKLMLKLNADYFVSNDEQTLVPLQKEKIIPCFNFHNEKRVSDFVNNEYLMSGRSKGYDHYLHFEKDRSLVLRNDKYLLDITTDFDGVLIYSDNYAFNETTIDNRKGIRKALAVEPQDSPLERKSYSDYSRFIKYSFKKI